MISIKIVELISPDTFSKREIETQQNKKKRRERTFMKKFSTILVYKGKRMFQVSLFRDFSRKRVFAQLA